ncbi:MAG: peptidase A24, partial [Desulfofundulus sp.]
PEFVWPAFLYTAVVGGLISLVIMARGGDFSTRLKAAIITLLSLAGIVPRVNLLDTIYDHSAKTFPYGLAIAAGTALAYLLR